MKYTRLLTHLSTAASVVLLVVACDNGGTQLVNGGVATIDFFDMEEVDSETIPYEPELGFALPDRGPLTLNSSVIGTTTQGADYRVDCSAGKVLVGVEGFAWNNRVNQVTALCTGVDSSGNWTGNAAAEGQAVGISSGTPFALTCPGGQAVTGITGVTSNDAVGYLQLHCRKLANRTTTTGAEQLTGTVGQYNWSFGKRLCGGDAVATGMHGRADNDLKAFGVVCNESPATAGRWSNPFAWPVQAVHAIMTPQGDIMSYGFRSGSGNVFDYDVWSPELGKGNTSHNTFASDVGVFSFCNASVVMPSNGNILLPGGTKLRSDNAGVADVPVYNPESGALTRAPDMSNPRWYPTTVVMPNGEILVAGGRDVAGVPINTPEMYSPETNEWRSLFGASMLGLQWTYPRLWLAADGRVFGISENQMYYINTEGSGALQKVATFPNEFRTTSEATAVMYRPGKILQVGGNVSNGVKALKIDINGVTPQATATNDMNISRSAWQNSTIMADGKVMVMGGSRVVNDAPTAALNAEIWDPDTEIWTVVSSLQWPRLYHSNSVLLKDGTVLISGGGDPGPVTNYNAEIYSPPYLFDNNGDLATRPEISWAPDNGAYGQTLSINTDADVARVTMIKSTSVTHSFNVEQRFFELPVTSADTNGIQVQLPATATDASPGYYLVFIINSQGTPSEATIVKLGDEPGAEPPPAVVVPTPEPAEMQVNNVLVNGGFEQGKASWLDCSDAALSTISNRANNGSKSLRQQSGACLYQEFVVQPNETYTMTCDARQQNPVYSSISLNMLDADYTTIANEVSVVSGNTYTGYGSELTAAANARFAAVTLYSEGTTNYDSCVVTTAAAPAVPQPTPQPSPQPVPPEPQPEPQPAVAPASNLLANSDFEQDKANWYDCSAAQLTGIVNGSAIAGKVLEVKNSGCIYQEFPVTVGKQYRLQCIAQSEGTQYSSISFQIADENYTTLDSKVSVVGPGAYMSYENTLVAPANSTSGAVTIYSEDITRIEACYVEEL